MIIIISFLSKCIRTDLMALYSQCRFLYKFFLEVLDLVFKNKTL